MGSILARNLVRTVTAPYQESLYTSEAEKEARIGNLFHAGSM